MKVALIGNMNNNNFSIMRYLRDLEIDAHLLLMKNDYTKAQTHFAPESDTWEPEKWNPFIHYLDYSDRDALLLKSKKKLKNDFEEYDILIGSGLIPGIMYKCGINLDIFYPYGAGIENVGERQVRCGYKGVPFYKKPIKKLYRNFCIKGIKNTRICLNAENTLTKQTFNELGIEYLNIPIPMVYNKEATPNNKIHTLEKITNQILQYNYKFLCHVRHDSSYKNHEPYIKGYAKFIKTVLGKNSILVLFEYGNNTEKTKLLIKELGISENVLWVEKKLRKEILFILKHIDIGFNTFEGLLWGGTGWEFLSKGIPFFHSFNITSEQYQLDYGVPMPPFINTDSPDEICRHLVQYAENPEPYKKIGAELKEWFEKYGGIGLAEKWRDIIVEIYNQKKNI